MTANILDPDLDSYYIMDVILLSTPMAQSAASSIGDYAEQLALRGPFTVITNSTLVAQELWASPQRGNIHLLGGSYFGDGYEILGPQVVEQIRHHHKQHRHLMVEQRVGNRRSQVSLSTAIRPEQPQPAIRQRCKGLRALERWQHACNVAVECGKGFIAEGYKIADLLQFRCLPGASCSLDTGAGLEFGKLRMPEWHGQRVPPGTSTDRTCT
mgnify:CR=1 FL=1